MAKKDSTVYFCNECGYESSKWMGQCPACKAWNTFVEEKVDKKILSSSAKRNEAGSKPVSLSQISTDEEEREIIGIWSEEIRALASLRFYCRFARCFLIREKRFCMFPAKRA